MKSFDIDNNAVFGIEEAAFWHTVGIVLPAKVEIGTAAAVRWYSNTLLLTAHHVIEGTANQDLRFFFRPRGAIQRRDWWQNDPRSVPIKPPETIDVVARHVNQELDIAALVVTPNTETDRLVKFCDLDGSEAQHPIRSSVVMIGFPADSRTFIAPGAVALSPYSMWANIESGSSSDRSVEVATHSQLKFHAGEEGRHPGGFSGAGVWYRVPTPPPQVWHPNVRLAGICTHYYPRRHMLAFCKLSHIVNFLTQALPPGQ